MRQLDGLRAIAVFAVMVHHFERERNLPLPLGMIGVQLFFVLSGFLITGILLRARRRVDAQLVRPRAAIATFYIRRVFRIFPLFYATLALAWLLGVPEVRDNLWWHLGYASNVFFARLGYWTENVSHLWSLSVEEQFYLVWPFVIIFTPRRLLPAALVAAVAMGPLYRGIGVVTGLTSTAHWLWFLTMPMANIDSLALGGLLAYAAQADDKMASLKRSLPTAGGWIGVPLVIGLCAMDAARIWTPLIGHARFILDITMWALAFVWLIDRASRGFRGIAGRVLQSAPLVYLGKISYGLYVIHLLLVRGLPWTFGLAGLDFPPPSPVRFLYLTAATVALASVSWFALERPLNDLKNTFAEA